MEEEFLGTKCEDKLKANVCMTDFLSIYTKPTAMHKFTFLAFP